MCITVLIVTLNGLPHLLASTLGIGPPLQFIDGVLEVEIVVSILTTLLITIMLHSVEKPNWCLAEEVTFL